VKAHGRKAMPSLLTRLGDFWRSSKFENPEDQYASYHVQKALSEITKKDNPQPGRYAVSYPGVTLAASQFVSVSRIWASWWGSRGHLITTFKSE
jgi:hypothetical protein